MSFTDIYRAVATFHRSTHFDIAGISTKSKRTAFVDIIALTRHKVDNLVLTQLVKLTGVCVPHTENISRVFNHGNLHTEADAKIRDILFSCIFCRQDHTFDSTAAETSGHKYTVKVCQLFIGVFCRDFFRIDPVYADMSIVIISGVTKCLRYRKICIMQSHVLAHKTDIDIVRSCLDTLYHCRPFRKVGFGCINTKFTANNRRKIRFFQHKRGFIKIRQCNVFNNTIRLYITEHRNLLEYGFFQRFITTENDNIRLHAHALQFFYRVLSRLGFMFVRTS